MYTRVPSSRLVLSIFNPSLRPKMEGQIIERIGSLQFASVDQTHEQIADSGAGQRLVEECIPRFRMAFFGARSTRLALGCRRKSVSFGQ